MNLEQIKNDYVKHEFQGVFENWNEFQNYYASRHPEYFENHWHNVIELVQKECLKRASENAEVDNILELNGDRYSIVNEESITNENNIIK